jgi:anti-sigma28 factor (negative regulator of flagellin synthesis)
MEGLEPAFAAQQEPSCHVYSRRVGEFAAVAGAFSGVEIRAMKVADIKHALESGAYRVTAHVLAACLMLEMIR